MFETKQDEKKEDVVLVTMNNNNMHSGTVIKNTQDTLELKTKNGKLVVLYKYNISSILCN